MTISHAADLRERLQDALGAGYRIDREVGGGGMSRVFAARDMALNRDIVVKVLPPDLAGEVSVERFKREIQIAASLQHPHIVPVHAAGDVDGLPYYTMPLVEGESLRDRLSRMQRLELSEALPILRDIARALAHAHRRGVAHRDIKPENVLITHGVAVVTDFGIAKAIAAARAGESAEGSSAVTPAVDASRAGLTQTGTSLGTPNYMAPEQAAGDPRTDHRADLYALGVVAYELLSGAAPFHGRTPRERLAAQLAERPRDLAALRLDLAPSVARLIMRCLEKEPDARPQSADDVVRELDQAIGGAPAEPVGDEPAVIRRAFALYVVAFVAVTAVAWLATRGIGLPDWVLPGTAIVMALGLPVVAFTAMTRYAAFRSAAITAEGSGAKAWHLTTGSRGRWAAQQLSWRRVATGGALSLGGFGALVAGFMFMRNAGIGPAGSLIGKGTLQARERLLVTDFRVAGVDSDLAGAVTIAARSGLMQSRAVTVLPGEVVSAALERMRRPKNAPIDLELGRELATREGLRAVVAGHVIRTGNKFDVGLRLVSADSGRDLAAFHRAAAGVEDILPTIDLLTRDLRGKIGESLKSVRSSPPLPQLTTSSMKALRLYADAERAGERERTLTLLREAIAADSEFAMAYRKMWVLGAFTPEGDSALVKAVRYSARLPERERLIVDGAHYTALYLFPDADRNRAVSAYQQLAAIGDPTAMNNLPELLNNRREYARAESLDQINVRQFPNDASMRGGWIHRLIELNRLDDAERALDAALKQFPRNWELQWWKIRMLYFRGNFDAFEHALDSVRAVPELGRRRVASNMRADMALLRGRLAERERLWAEARALNASTRDNGGSLSPLARAGDDLWLALMKRDGVSNAVQRLDALLRDNPPRGPQEASGVVFQFTNAGRPDLARTYLERFLGPPSDTMRQRRESSHFVHQALASIAVAENRPREALVEIRLGDTYKDGFPGPCHLCLYRDLGWAFDKAGEADSAIVMFERFLNMPSRFTLMTQPGDLQNYLRRLGELYQAKGNRDKAIEYYSRFVDLWKNADPELQPQVAEVRAKLTLLRGQ